MKKLFVLIVIAWVAIEPTVANAQPNPMDSLCTPPCRTGFICHNSQCISACNPPCGEAEVCAQSGECVSRCNPACAANEVCAADGQCRSKCNPMCAPGLQCTATGACATTGYVAPGGVGAPLGGPQPFVGPADEGWASTGGKVGIAGAVAIAGLTTVIVAADDEDIGIPVGSVATVIAGVTIPIAAAGGSSARKHPGVIGAPGMRLAGWIFYGLSLADAVTLLGLAVAGADIPPAVVASVGLLGTSSAVFMSLDAFDSAKQARAVGGGAMVQSPRPTGAMPFVGALHDAGRNSVPTAGVAWSW
jgi:hypothetical protein